ncbi:hypothetical protein ZX61_09895 [Vibrio sp. VPAP30]|nr:hypothetical protein ZX61_09895 [Vibrio sp. VPAP30]
MLPSVHCALWAGPPFIGRTTAAHKARHRDRHQSSRWGNVPSKISPHAPMSYGYSLALETEFVIFKGALWGLISEVAVSAKGDTN